MLMSIASLLAADNDFACHVLDATYARQSSYWYWIPEVLAREAKSLRGHKLLRILESRALAWLATGMRP